MEDKVELWRKVLAGDGSVNSLEFGGLIPTDATENFLWDLFGTLPRAGSMIEKIVTLQRENYCGAYIVPERGNFLPQSEIETLARRWQQDVTRFCKDRDGEEFIEDLSGRDIKWFSRNEEFLDVARNEFAPISGVDEYIGDVFRTHAGAMKPWGYGLKEAVHFLTTYNGITRYILEDVFSFPLRGRPYYDLWKAGGDVLFMEGYMAVLSEG